MFSVDFETLERIIQQLLYTGIFRASVGASHTFPEAGYIELQVREGRIYGSYFVSARGKTYKLDRWDAQLAPLGVLDWKLAQSQRQSSGLLPQVSSSSSAASGGNQQITAGQGQLAKEIPSHVVAFSLAQLRQWPTLHRQVYSLIDGRRPASEIAQILHKPLLEIERIIQDLRQRAFIQVG